MRDHPSDLVADPIVRVVAAYADPAAPTASALPGLAALIERERLPLIKARVALCLAEANLNGIVAQLAAGQTGLGLDKPEAIVRQVNKAVSDARHAMDRARFAVLDIDHLNCRPLCTNDPDDMGDALLHAIDLIETRTRFHGDPDDEHRLTAADLGVGRYGRV